MSVKKILEGKFSFKQILKSKSLNKVDFRLCYKEKTVHWLQTLYL